MPTSQTFHALHRAVCEEAFRGRWPIFLTSTDIGTSVTAAFDTAAIGTSNATVNSYGDVWLYLYRHTGTATAGAASTITFQVGTSFADDAINNWTINLTGGTGSGQSRRITDWILGTRVATVDSAWVINPDPTTTYEIIPFSSAITFPVRSGKVLTASGFAPTTGTFTFAPAIQTNGVVHIVQDRTEFLFHHFGLHPDIVTGAINRILRNLVHDAYIVVTLVTDGDMEDTGITNWARVGAAPSVTTHEKSTTAVFPFGRQSLHMLVTALGVGANSNPFRVTPNEPLWLSVPVRVDSGNLDVQLYDDTNAVVLKSVRVSASGSLERVPVEVYFQQNAGATTNNCRVRFLAGTGSAEFYAGPVSVLSGWRRRYSVDSVERAADIRELFSMRQGTATTVADIFLAAAMAQEAVSFAVERDDRSQSPINIVIPSSWVRPLFMRARKRYPEITLDSDTTTADRDLVVQGALYHVERALAALSARGSSEEARHLQLSVEHARGFSRLRAIQGYGIEVLEAPAERVWA